MAGWGRYPQYQGGVDVAKDGKGRFASAPDFMPQLKYEEYMNVHREVVAFAADTTDPGLEVVPTQMTAAMGDAPGSVAGRKWVLFGCTVQPLTPVNINPLEAAVETVRFQLCKGVQAALLSGELPDVIAELKYAQAAVTQGGANDFWPKPLDIITPTPLVNAHLTLLQDTGINAPAYANHTWLWKVYWGWADAKMSDYSAIVQMGMDVA